MHVCIYIKIYTCDRGVGARAHLLHSQVHIYIYLTMHLYIYTGTYHVYAHIHMLCACVRVCVCVRECKFVYVHRKRQTTRTRCSTVVLRILGGKSYMYRAPVRNGLDCVGRVERYPKGTLYTVYKG